MKKLIFLISLCLLSQNYTIANENGESHYNTTSSSLETNDVNFLRVQNAYSSSTLKLKEQPKDDGINKSNLKFPGLNLSAPQVQEASVSQKDEQPQSNLTSETKTEIDTETEKITENTIPAKEETQPQVQNDFQNESPSILKYVEQNYEVPVRNIKKDTAASNGINKSELKFPGLKLPAGTEGNNLQEENKSESVQPETHTEQTVEPKETAKQTAMPAPQEQKPLDAMEVLRSHTTLPIKSAKKVKRIPQKYRLNKNSIVVEKRNNEQDPNQPIKITIKKVEFPQSKIFTPDELQGLAAPLLSQPVTFEEIQKVVADITRCYTLGNYPTAKAYLPPQRVNNGVLKIGLLEGTIGKINVEDNRWVRSSYVKNRIAKNKEGELLNVRDIEKDVIKYNNNNSSKVRVFLSPGENQGESDITLKVDEKSPFRISVMTDNMGRKAIGTGRFGSVLSTDNLLGIGDKFALGGYLGRGNRIGFSDYSLPVGNHGTRIGASAAASNISVVNGPLRQFDVGGTSQSYSIYVTQPLFDSEGSSIGSYTAVNFKKSTSDILDYKFYDHSTLSLTQGFNARKDTDRGIWYTGHYASVGFKTDNDNEDFFKYEGNLTRLHDFGKGIIGQFKVSGQYSPDNNLPWMEQFQIGGMSTVRGYSEALLLGKSGYFASAEILTPLPILPKRIGSDKLGYIYPRDMIKGAVFMDHGMIFPYKYGESIDSGELLLSWGFGLRVNIKDDLAARFYWGYGLHNKYEQDHKMGRFHFDITCAPDIGRLVESRHPAKKAKKRKKDKQIEENL